jgi:hypothetical protein
VVGYNVRVTTRRIETMSDQDYQDGFDQGYDSGYADAEQAAESVQDDADAEIAKLREEVAAKDRMVNKYAYERDLARRERDTAERELAEARGLLEKAHIHVVCSNRAGWGGVVGEIESFLAKEQANG